MIQLISRAPAPIRAFADMDTFGPICAILEINIAKNVAYSIEAANPNANSTWKKDLMYSTWRRSLLLVYLLFLCNLP
ncbi:hypothetical protein Hanom_Chr12g01168071 [Helianthus anomalus]